MRPIPVKDSLIIVVKTNDDTSAVDECLGCGWCGRLVAVFTLRAIGKGCRLGSCRGAEDSSAGTTPKAGKSKPFLPEGSVRGA